VLNAPERRHYKLVQRIATGGMGEVFLANAEGAAGFQRKVVIKKVHPRWSHNADVMSLFRDEARLGAALDHQNIVRVLDYGKSGDGVFIVLEYIEGRNLAELITVATERREYLPAEIVAWVGMQCCQALEHIHGRKTRAGDHLGVVHRDINPANVLLSSSGEVKLTDFGVAAGHHRELKTAHGILRGTFPYMSPEQTRCQPLEGRSDIFSLAIVLYEALTAHHPFADDEDYLTIKAIQEEVPPSPDDLRRDVDPALSAIIMRALGKDPEDRQDSARALHADLRAWLRKSERRASAPRLADLMGKYFPHAAPRGESVEALRIALGPTTPGTATRPILDLSSLDLRPGNKRVGGAILPKDPEPVVEEPLVAEPEFSVPDDTWDTITPGDGTRPLVQPKSDADLAATLREAYRVTVDSPDHRDPAPWDRASVQRGPVALDGIKKAPARRPEPPRNSWLGYMVGCSMIAGMVGGLVYAIWRFT